MKNHILIEEKLKNVRQNHKTTNYSEILQILKDIKSEYVKERNEEMSKHIWCLETISFIQSSYITAYKNIISKKYYDAWCLLERCEISLKNVQEHMHFNSNEFLIKYISEKVQKLQALFPYKIFGSPAYVIEKRVCSICHEEIKLRSKCSHKKGEIYEGEQCIYIIEKCRLLEISLVKHPHSKYTVPFLKDENGNTIDTYYYGKLDFLTKYVTDPFDFWDYELTTKDYNKKFFSKYPIDATCPCESEKLYKDCCYGKNIITVPHTQFILPTHLIS